ncbi:MAG TPA: potassium-transporting ATPase subunit C, partial [Acidobacteriaceae bacterium]|nr:potassium-transporting ATPase subunit C [Acidobacteriaceae bacterium]
LARERGLPQAQLQKLVTEHTEPRQFGFLGEPRVNVLELNLALDQALDQPALQKAGAAVR